MRVTFKKAFVPSVLAFAVVLSLLMAALKFIPHGHRYDLAVKVSLALALFWLIYEVRPDWLLRKGVLVLAVLAGLGLGIGEISVINPRSEIVQVYQTVFDAMDSGNNPYTSGTIFHYAEFYKVVYGNFNYPPVEIYPYYAAYKIAGAWNSTVMTAVFLVLHALVCLVFLWTFPRVKRRYLAAFFLLFLFTEIITNPAMTFLVTALVLLVIKKNEVRPRPVYRYLIAVLFGIGLMTKFLVIPFMAAYYWHRFDRKNLKSLGPIAVDTAISLATAVLLMAPFGVRAVFKETILFNLILRDRAVMTTYFPNILSGPLVWLGLDRIYPYAAVLILGIAVLWAPRLRVIAAMMAASYAFLMVSPTPEPQFIPVMLYLALFGAFATLEVSHPAILRGPAAAAASGRVQQVLPAAEPLVDDVPDPADGPGPAG